MILGYPISGMMLRLKGQRLRSEGHKMQKHIEGDRVAGVSYTLYQVLMIIIIIIKVFVVRLYYTMNAGALQSQTVKR